MRSSFEAHSAGELLERRERRRAREGDHLLSPDLHPRAELGRECLLDAPRLGHRDALREHRPDRGLERRAEADRAPAARLLQQPADHRIALAHLGQPGRVHIEREHARRVGLDLRRRQVGAEVDVDDLPRPDRAQRDRIPAVVGQRDHQRLSQRERPARPQRDRHLSA